MATWKPTSAECKIIRDCAAREAQRGDVRLEIGGRYNTDDPARTRDMPDHECINIALVTCLRDDSWDDTDLSETLPWQVFRKGVTLTPDGRAICDFYIYDTRRHEGWLHGNVVAYYADGRLAKVLGVGAHGRPLYEAP